MQLALALLFLLLIVGVGIPRGVDTTMFDHLKPRSEAELRKIYPDANDQEIQWMVEDELSYFT